MVHNINNNSVPLPSAPILQQVIPPPLFTQSASAEGSLHTSLLLNNLQDALPTSEDIGTIFGLVSQDSIFFHQMMVLPYTQIAFSSFRAPESIAKLPTDSKHTVLIAKDLFALATLLQGLQSLNSKQVHHLSKPLETMVTQLVHAATSFMSAGDDSIMTMEALECILLEGIFYANGGNLRRSWLTFRRLISIAQLLDMHCSTSCDIQVLDPHNKAEPRFMWFRIVYTERLLCLLLGKPMCSPEIDVLTDPIILVDEHPLQKLERIHCGIASRILRRNDNISFVEQVELTQAIDLDLQNAANVLPQHWWPIPNLINLTDNCERFWAVTRLTTQLFHHHLLVQLHMPFLLRTFKERKYDYNITTCVNSSREILTRFVTLRSLDTVAFNCRAIDFFAVTAAVAILLAHISSRCTCQRDDILAHQRLSDRALVEQARGSMDVASRICRDFLYEENAQALERMLEAENYAHYWHTWIGKCQDSVFGGSQPDLKHPTIQLRLPHFREVSITCSTAVQMQSETAPAMQRNDASSNTALAHEQSHGNPASIFSSLDESATPIVNGFLEQDLEFANPNLVETGITELSVFDKPTQFGEQYTTFMLDNTTDNMDPCLL